MKRVQKQARWGQVLLLAMLAFTSGARASELLSPCHQKGIEDQLMCGQITRPVSAEADKGMIDIHFAVIPAIKRHANKQAIMAFAGGPGQSALEAAPIFERALRFVRETHDIILVDQRGTGQSRLLQCDIDSLEEGFAFNDSVLDFSVFSAQEAQRCKDKLNVDLSDFTTYAAAADFEAVRVALGYPAIHLYGGSYGTRIAQEYMRQFPASVQTAVLDGVVPMQQSLAHIGDAIHQSLDALFEHCAQQPSCAQRYPALAEQYQQLLNTVTANPVEVEVRHPRTHARIPLVLTAQKVQSVVRMALYSHLSRALVPFAIAQASQGEYDSLVGLMASSDMSDSLAMGMHAAVVCGEDWPILTSESRARLQQRFFSKTMVEVFDATCPVWDVKPVPAHFYQPLTNDVPVLLLSGALDPATPPSWAELAMVSMPNATHWVAPYATHIVASQSCAPKLIAQFVKDKSVQDIDAACLQKDGRKPFFTNENGPLMTLGDAQ